MALTPGSRLGPYEVTALLGEGGMGTVYRATDTNLKRQVAVKVLPASVAADAIHPVVALAASNLDFLCIHPFHDGNGRVSRLLWLLQSYHLGYDVGRYISLERLVEEHKDRQIIGNGIRQLIRYCGGRPGRTLPCLRSVRRERYLSRGVPPIEPRRNFG